MLLQHFVCLHSQLLCFFRPGVQKLIQKNPFTNQPNLPSILLNLFFFPVPPSRIIFSFFAESFCSELSKLHTPMLFRQSMFGTKRVLTVITLKRHVRHIPTVGALFLQHDKVRVFFPNKLSYHIILKNTFTTFIENFLL